MALRQDVDGVTVIPSRTKGAHLRLDAVGFTAVTRRGEKGRTWNEVAGFRPANVKMGTPSGELSGPPLYQIGFFLREPPSKGRIGRWIVRRVYRVDDTLPGVYPDAEEIVVLMERWRQRHSTATPAGRNG
jgi:hypothetical protein